MESIRKVGAFCAPGPGSNIRRTTKWGVCPFSAACLVLLVFGGHLYGQNQPNQGATLGTTVQLPSLGVEVDANGLLSLTVTDMRGDIRAARADAARKTLPRDVQRHSTSRKVSLRRLAAAIDRALESGEALDPVIVHLAGLRRLDHVFLFPHDHDVILSGPAGGWFEEPSGRIVSLEDRQPLLLLDDLITALRAFGPNDPLNKVVLCSIDPSPEGLSRYKKLKRDLPIKFTPAEWAVLPDRLSVAMREALGPSSIRVHGVPRSSHIGQVMVECDYRMKLIGIGLEPEPVEMETFIEAIDRPISGFQQWWLRPDYKRLVQDPQAESLRLLGSGIELVTNRLEVTADDRLSGSRNRSSAAASRYAEEFTEKYDRIAEASPVFAQLRNLSDLLVVAAWLRRIDAWQRVEWDGGVLNDASRLPSQEMPVPKTVHSVARAVTKGDLLFTPAGGGFSITPAISLDDEHLTIGQTDDPLHQRRLDVRLPEDDQTWWWD
jgi:hypothetical protein